MASQVELYTGKECVVPQKSVHALAHKRKVCQQPWRHLRTKTFIVGLVTLNRVRQKSAEMQTSTCSLHGRHPGQLVFGALPHVPKSSEAVQRDSVAYLARVHAWPLRRQQKPFHSELSPVQMKCARVWP